MTRDELAKAGEVLYGPSWKRPLARELDVPERSLYHWLAGRTSIPLDMSKRLARLAASRHQAIGRLYDRLLRSIPGPMAMEDDARRRKAVGDARRRAAALARDDAPG